MVDKRFSLNWMKTKEGVSYIPNALYPDIPETEDVAAVISLGYRDIDPEMPKRKEVEAITKFF